jgi:hypothetical protein
MGLSRFCLLLSSVLLFALAGCKPEDEIAKETVNHADREKIRLRVAIVERKLHVYFFRMSGPLALVNQQEATFNDFVQSAQFVGNKRPTWNEPKGWKKDPPTHDSPIGGLTTIARYRLDAKPKELELVVTRMPAKGFDLMTNMHRWQKQVNVGLTETREELKQQVKEKNGVEWVDLTGLAVHTVSKRPELGEDKAKKSVLPLPASLIPFEYKMPEGWVRNRPRKMTMGMILEVIDVNNPKDDDEKAEVTFTNFAKDGGGLGPNINRWRKQIELPELDDIDAVNLTMKWDVVGVKASFVDLDNPDGPERNRTLGVIIPLENSTWFIKMSGPSEWVGENKQKFEDFVKSLKQVPRSK